MSGINPNANKIAKRRFNAVQRVKLSRDTVQMGVAQSMSSNAAGNATLNLAMAMQGEPSRSCSDMPLGNIERIVLNGTLEMMPTLGGQRGIVITRGWVERLLLVTQECKMFPENTMTFVDVVMGVSMRQMCMDGLQRMSAYFVWKTGMIYLPGEDGQLLVFCKSNDEFHWTNLLSNETMPAHAKAYIQCLVDKLNPLSYMPDDDNLVTLEHHQQAWWSTRTVPVIKYSNIDPSKVALMQLSKVLNQFVQSPGETLYMIICKANEVLRPLEAECVRSVMRMDPQMSNERKHIYYLSLISVLPELYKANEDVEWFVPKTNEDTGNLMSSLLALGNKLVPSVIVAGEEGEDEIRQMEQGNDSDDEDEEEELRARIAAGLGPRLARLADAVEAMTNHFKDESVVRIGAIKDESFVLCLSYLVSIDDAEEIGDGVYAHMALFIALGQYMRVASEFKGQLPAKLGRFITDVSKIISSRKSISAKRDKLNEALRNNVDPAEFPTFESVFS